MSIYISILEAVKSSIITVFANTTVRAKTIVFEKTDTLPICIVAPGLNGEQIDSIQFTNQLNGQNSNTWWNYPILVSYIDVGNRLVNDTALTTYLNNREAIRNQLYQVPVNLAISPGIFDIDFNTLSGVEYPEFEKTMYHATGYHFFIRSNELRAGV